MTDNQPRPACEGHNPELWFPEDSRANDGTTAKAICHTCPLRTPCLNVELETNRLLGTGSIWGIYGGLDADQRRALLTQGAA